MNEKILELLSKKNLTEDEKKELSFLFEREPDLKKYRPLLNLLGNMKKNFHLPIDIISDYVLYKNNLPLEDDSLNNFIPHIEKHISECEKCRNEFNLLNNELSEIGNYLTETLSGKSENKSRENIKAPTKIFKLFTTKKFFSAAAILAIMTFSLFTSSKLLVPSYQNISELSGFNSSATRGRVNPYFQKGMEALNKNNYSEAIKRLKNDIVKNKDDKTIFYTDYLLGITYLKKSESSLLGLFPSFNPEDLDSAILYFNKTISENRLDAFQNISSNSYFFIGKGYLLQGDKTKAKKYFKIVIEQKGRFIKEAEKLITLIDKDL